MADVKDSNIMVTICSDIDQIVPIDQMFYNRFVLNTWIQYFEATKYSIANGSNIF